MEIDIIIVDLRDCIKLISLLCKYKLELVKIVFFLRSRHFFDLKHVTFIKNIECKCVLLESNMSVAESKESFIECFGHE